ncbi:AAA family ATPase [Paludisphaera mucosa]|uniref:AAA family ATPase n=1 Tax=Paludisphaera mucosa TaxID=3030827 RepID=A0ABT6FJV1_9BACT|nr:ATP-binding protein [Paludisphaera mucosa]MDG3007633.1 AAA family ATPase [Paludisphaera mucosa]
MFLQRLVLENVRAIESLDLSFAAVDAPVRKWTLMLGQNGCGKSTVLKAVALLLAGSEALPELIGDPDSWIRLKADRCRMAADLVTAEGETRHVELSLKRGDHIRRIFEDNKESLDRLDRALAHAARNYLVVGYGVSRRLGDPGGSSSEVFTHPRSRSVATMFSNDATLSPLETWAIALDYERGEEGLKIVRSTLDDLLPDVSFERIDKSARKLLFRTPDGVLPLDQLSDGYQNAAGWCGDLLYRILRIFEDYKNPLSARGLLLIDEMDLHLHPVWKRRLVDYLSSKLPNFQILATTHSALTVHQAGPGELFVLKRDAEHAPPTLHAFEGEPRKLMLHQLLISPIFGLETADSRSVEQTRAEFQGLRDKPRNRLTTAERARLPELERELLALPDWDAAKPEEAQRRELLEDIRLALRDDVDRKPGREGRPKRGAATKPPGTKAKTKPRPGKS